MTYSYSQISQYLTCPRRYRHRYLDGCQEKEQWAAMVFGQAFEKAVAALFRHEDPAVVLFEQWSAYKDSPLLYPTRDTWDGMLQQGVQLLERSVLDRRVQIRRPKTQQQVQFTRQLGSGNNFVSYIDAIGELDGTACVLEWTTSSARYPEEPAGITGLDPQLICYSWMTGIDAVAQVVFVRKRTVEVQSCGRPSRTNSARNLKHLVEDAVGGIGSGMYSDVVGQRQRAIRCTMLTRVTIEGKCNEDNPFNGFEHAPFHGKRQAS
jgi:hypothetical protein